MTANADALRDAASLIWDEAYTNIDNPKYGALSFAGICLSIMRDYLAPEERDEIGEILVQS